MAFVFSFGDIYSMEDDSGKVYLLRDIHASGQTFRVMANLAILSTYAVNFKKAFVIKKGGLDSQVYAMSS